MAKYIDYLTEDDPIPNQNWVCLSFVAPESKNVKQCTLRGVKIRGVFNNREDADKHALELRKKDPDFDIYVGEVGKWLPLDPTHEQVEDEHYQEKELNNLVAGYKKSREQSKQLYEQRKQEMMEKASLEEEDKLTKVRNRLRKKLAQKRAIRKQQESKLPNEKQVNDMLEKLKEEENKLKEEENKLKEEQDEITKENIELLKDKNELNDIEKQIDSQK
jgi:DNA repair exonuclease SbcCD ATPase subunit